MSSLSYEDSDFPTAPVEGISAQYYEVNNNRMTTQPLTGLSDVQEMVLAILPIPSAALSIFGSSCIIYMSLRGRSEKSWTPYTRLLLAMSICDIVSSMTLAVAAFMRPKENGRVWAFGSGATCSAIGLLTQFSYSGLFYNSMLSLYFLLSTRFRLKNEVISRRFEPLMHVVSLGFPIVTAIVGAVMGVYSTTTSELGCWVNDFPRGCIGDECLSITIGWYYFGMPFLISFGIIGLCNLTIFIFVRQKTRPKLGLLSRENLSTHPIGDLAESIHSKTVRTAADGNDTTNPVSIMTEGGSHSFSPSTSPKSTTRLREYDSNLTNPQDGSSISAGGTAPSYSFISGSFRTIVRQSSSRNNKSSLSRTTSDYTDVDVQRQQMKRLRLILSQALLFVASYVFTAGWLGLLRIIESMAETPEDELRMVTRIYPLMAINAIMAPLQGFFNMLVFIRPKYLKWMNEYPMESRLWVFQRCIFGRRVRPTIRYVVPNPLQEEPKDSYNNRSPMEPATTRRKSLDTKDSGFCQEDEEEGYDDDENKKVVLDNTPGFHSSFPRNMVSTLTASIGDFDHVLEEGQPDERWQCTSARSNTIPLWNSSRLHSSGTSSLEVISELSVSHFEAHPTPSGSCNFDEEEDYSSSSGDSSSEDDMMMDLQASPPLPQSSSLLLPKGSNHSEDRWSASSPRSSSRRRQSNDDSTGDQWSPASSKKSDRRLTSSDRSPTLHRTNRLGGRRKPVRINAAGSVMSSSEDDRSDSRWSSYNNLAAAQSPLQGSSRTMQPEIPRRLVTLVSEQSEFGDSLAEEPIPSTVASSSAITNDCGSTSSSSLADTPLQPPTRRMSPSAADMIRIPNAPIL